MKPASDARKRDQQRIHIIRGQVGMSLDEYHDLIGALFDGKRSSRELDTAQRQRLVAHMEGVARRYGGAAARPARTPLTPHQKKMFSLWQQLADAGLVRERGMPALRKYITRQTQVQRMEWLNSHQEVTVIESLKRWLSRGAEVGSAEVGSAQGAANA
jgi:hypothetical protein